MENEIHIGDYVKLNTDGYYSKDPLTQDLYMAHYGDIGLVRMVKYTAGTYRKVAEVIFDHATYISEVPMYLLLRIGTSEFKRIPEPDMQFKTIIGRVLHAKYIIFTRNDSRISCAIGADEETFYGILREESF